MCAPGSRPSMVVVEITVGGETVHPGAPTTRNAHS